MRILVIAITFFLFAACASTLTLADIENKWGPPASVVDGPNTITYFYYFDVTSAMYMGSPRFDVPEGSAIAGVEVAEVTADKSGNVIKTRRYLKQPTTPP